MKKRCSIPAGSVRLPHQYNSGWIVAVWTATAIVVASASATAAKGGIRFSDTATRFLAAAPDKVSKSSLSSSTAPSQTPSMEQSRIMAASLFTNNGQVSVTSTPTSAPTMVTANNSYAMTIQNNGTVAPSLALTSANNPEDSLLAARIPDIAIAVEVQEAALETLQPLETFWEGWVDNLLRASIQPSSSFRYSDLDVSLLQATPKTLGILLSGTAYLVDVEDTATMRNNSTALGEALRHSLTSYISFWGTQEMEAALREQGLLHANVTSISLYGIDIGLEDHHAWARDGPWAEGQPGDDSAASILLEWDAWVWATILTSMVSVVLFC